MSAALHTHRSALIKMMDRVKLDNCILGKNTQVGSKAELTRCITQAGYEINAGGGQSFLSQCSSWINFDLIEVIKGEKLEASDWTADPEDDLSLSQERLETFETNKEIFFLS